MTAERAARLEMEMAKKRGVIPPLDGNIPCADCGKLARDWDHRDYLLSWRVEPTCRSCNVKRGEGLNKHLDVTWERKEYCKVTITEKDTSVINEAERIRKQLGLYPEKFSVRLGFSPGAYRLAVKRGKLSRWMATEIRRRFWRHVETV